MFKVTMTDTVAKVVRTVKLPSSGPLKEITLSDTYTVKLDLAGLAPTSPVRKAILKSFPSVYEKQLNATRKTSEAPAVNLWREAGKLLKDGKASQAAVEKAAKAAESGIVSRWNTFNDKTAKPLAQSTVNSLAQSEAKKAKEKAIKPKIAFSSDDLKENRVGILTAILGAATLTIAVNPVTWVIAAIGGAAALMGGYKNAWEIAQKQSSDAQDNLNHIDDELTKTLAALKKLSPCLDRLVVSQTRMEAELVSAKSELAKMKSQLAKLEQRAKKEKAVREGDYLKSMLTAAETQMSKVASLKASIEQQAELKKAVLAATKSVETAGALVTARRKGWDKIMANFTKLSSDSQTFMSAVTKTLGQLK